MLKQENFLIVQLSHMEKYGTYDKVKKSLGQLDHRFIILLLFLQRVDFYEVKLILYIINQQLLNQMPVQAIQS